MLTAIEKVRQHLTGDPKGQPHFLHEGPHVVRWITGGTAPSVYVKVWHRGNEVIASCPECGQEFGCFDAHYGKQTYQQLAAIREAGHQHSCQ